MTRGSLFDTTARVLLVLVVLSLAGLRSADAAGDKARLEKVKAEVLETLKDFYPVRSSLTGVHEYDHRFADYSSKSVKTMVKKLEKYEKELKRFKDADLDRADWVDVKLLHSEIASSLIDLKELSLYKHSPQLYVDDAVNGLYALMVTDSLVPQERLYPIVKRLEAVPGLFATARKNITSAPQLYIDHATRSLETAQRFYQQAAGELMREYPDRADEILAKSTKAREAMNSFSEFLSNVKTDDKLADGVGDKKYEQILADRYFYPLSSDSLKSLLQNILDSTEDDYEQYVAYVEDDHQTGKDSVFVPHSFCREDLLDYYQWEISQVRIFITESDMINVSPEDEDLVAEETPAFLREVVNGTEYQPRLQEGQDAHAYLYVRPVPERLDPMQLAARYRYVHRRGFTPTVVHEAFPGKHLLLEQAANNEDAVRRWVRNPMMVEGWPLFCDQWAYETGVHGSENPPVWLSILDEIRLNAALALADARYNTGEMTFDQCVDWLGETVLADTDAERQYLSSRLWRCVVSPGECVAPVVGKMEIEHLRDSALAAEDKFYSEREFMDSLMAQGAIPPTLMWEALDLGTPDMAGL